MRPLIGTSLKMNFTSTAVAAYLTELTQLTATYVASDLFVLPPFTSIWVAREKLAGSSIAWGAQDVSTEDWGAHTGDISAPMLSDLGCTYVEVGHAERRRDHCETNERVAVKVARVLSQNMTPIVCIGEPDEVAPRAAIDVVTRQLRACLALVDAGQLDRIVIAYEPVWAIGVGGKPSAPHDVAAVHKGIHDYVRSYAGRGVTTRVIYGGSVDPTSAGPLLDQESVDGLFVGRAALDPALFARIALAGEPRRAA